MIYYQFHNFNGHWFGRKQHESNTVYQAKFSHNSAITNNEYYCIQPDWLVATFTESEFHEAFPELLV